MSLILSSLSLILDQAKEARSQKLPSSSGLGEVIRVPKRDRTLAENPHHDED
jgi:hypothetical protein